MRDAAFLIGNKLIVKDIRQLYRECGSDINNWPQGFCPECRNEVYFYGRPAFVYWLLGQPIPSGHEKPSFRHDRGTALGCSRAVQEYTHTKNPEGSVAQPLLKEDYLTEKNLFRMTAVLWEVFGPLNFPRDKVVALLQKGYKQKLWEYAFPAWATAYALLLSETTRFKFKNNNKHDICFVQAFRGDESWLTMVYANNLPKAVSPNYYAWPITEAATQSYEANYQRALLFDPSIHYGVPQQMHIYESLLKIPQAALPGTHARGPQAVSRAEP